MPLSGSPVSIEIGPQSVRVAQLSVRRGVVRTVRFAEQQYPTGARWEVGGDRAPVVEALRQALARAGIRARSAIIVLPRGQVTARVGAFPPATGDELRRVIEYDLADHIPFPVEQVVTDSQALGPSADQPGLVDVLVLAAPRELVREHLRVAQESGLRVTAVSVDAMALDDLARSLGREPAGMAAAVAIGPRATLINITFQGALRLTRSVATGDNQLLRAIQDDFGVDAAQAQRMRETDGLSLLEKAPRPGALRAWADNLLGEVRRSALSFGPGRITRTVLVTAEPTPGLRELVQAEFGVEPVVLTAVSAFPQAEFWGADPQTADRCLLSIGGALRGVGRSAWSVSLVPQEVQQARRAARLKRLAAAAVVVALAAMTTAAWSLSRRAVAARAQAAALSRKLAELEPQQAKAQALLAERASLEAEADSLQIVPVRRYAALELMRAVAMYAPKDIVLTHFTLRPEQPLELRGTADDPLSVAELQRTMGLSPLVKSASLTGIDRVSGRAGVGQRQTFTLQLKLWTEKEPESRAVSLRGQEGRR
ncbi:MAG: pilus assembly protein PilM [Armatimonadota bacterium]